MAGIERIPSSVVYEQQRAGADGVGTGRGGEMEKPRLGLRPGSMRAARHAETKSGHCEKQEASAHRYVSATPRRRASCRSERITRSRAAVSEQPSSAAISL